MVLFQRTNAKSIFEIFKERKREAKLIRQAPKTE